MPIDQVRNRFYGKYRGQVVTNIDPMHLGRLQVKVPTVLGDNTLNWALPCVPYAGKNVGFLALPPEKANIWVEFEGGDVNYPIWSGCFWGNEEMPEGFGLAELKFFKTQHGTLKLDDTPKAGGITLQIESPAVSGTMVLQMNSKGIQLSLENVTILQFSDAGIRLQNGIQSITLDKTSVSINEGALEIK
jgi:hypothetical protein